MTIFVHSGSPDDVGGPQAVAELSVKLEANVGMDSSVICGEPAHTGKEVEMTEVVEPVSSQPDQTVLAVAVHVVDGTIVDPATTVAFRAKQLAVWSVTVVRLKQSVVKTDVALPVTSQPDTLRDCVERQYVDVELAAVATEQSSEMCVAVTSSQDVVRTDVVVGW